MSFKVAKDAQGRVTACGPNKDSFDPQIPAGGTLEISNVFVPIHVSQAALDKAARRAATELEAEGDQFIDRLRTADPATIRAFVQTNVTDLASARQFIGRLAVAVSFALQGGKDK